jgi:DNA-binding SARP family transcriptional activator
MEFRILGPLEARRDGVPLALGGTKQRALLAVFLLHANEVVSTERLIDALWEKPPAKAVKAVQAYVSRLRKALGGGSPRSRPPGYVLELEPDQLDLGRFRRLVEEAQREPAGAADTLGEALALWRGPPLAEFASEPFARAERLHLEELRIEVLEQRIEAELALGRHASLVGELEALVAAEPLRERPRGQLMLALYRSGRQVEALAAYREGRRALVEELGIEPSRQLQELEQAILRQDPELELVDAQSGTRPPAAAPALRPRPVVAGEAAPGATPVEERKVITVLFCNLVGFSSRADLADPEDVRAALLPFRTAARREIERHGGTIEKFIGDAVVGLFGAPAAHEDDPERAVRAALSLRRWLREEGEGVEVRMAVTTGIALVSLEASPEAREATVAGDVLNTAQQLQAAAPTNAILVGEQTYRSTREAIAYSESSPVQATGEAWLPAWEALEVRVRVGVGRQPEQLAPLVGRRRELDLLLSTLARVREEHSPQLATLVGVPGIGKSRLIYELAKAVDQEPEIVSWRQGRCLPYGEGVSFWALGEVVKAQAGILESDSPAEAAAKLHQAVTALPIEPGEAPWVEEHLRALVGAGVEPASERAGEAFPAWRRFLRALVEVRPLVLVFEDLHWADEGLLEFLDELIERIRDAPLVLVCTARPELFERRPGWSGGKPNALTLSLPALTAEETGALLAALLEQRPLPPEVREGLLTRAAGNPLYAEQFVRLLGEGGSLEELPESVQGIIAARLDALAPDEKSLLQDAAVVGEVFWAGALVAIGGSRPRTEELLFGLERTEFTRQARRSSVAGEDEYAFRHVLLRDVAYGQIPRAARAEKHRRTALWIESLGRPEDHAEMLAHHYLNALEYTEAAGRADPALAERARLALRAAGDRAFALASYASATRFYTAALGLWPEDSSERVWLLVQNGRARHGDDGSGIDLLERGFEELRSRGDADGAAEVAIVLARCSWEEGDRDAAYAHVDEALELAEGRAGSKARAHALVARAAYHMLASEHEEAILLAREALPLTEELGATELRIRALDVLGASRTELGEVEGLDQLRQAIALARANNAFPQLLTAEVNLYESEFFFGDIGAAMQALHTFVDDGEKYATARTRTWVHTAEACEALLYGRWGVAIDILERLADEAESGADHYLEPKYRTLRASIELARGDLVGASEDSEKALARARRTKDPQLLAPALTLRSTVLLAQGKREKARNLADEVLALRPLVLLELFPTATPIEFAWHLHDLGRQQALLAFLEHAPSIPWVEGARAIAEGRFTLAVEIAARLQVPLIQAYTRLRAGIAIAEAGDRAEARRLAEPGLAFFGGVGAKRYLAQADEVLATSDER